MLNLSFGKKVQYDDLVHVNYLFWDSIVPLGIDVLFFRSSMFMNEIIELYQPRTDERMSIHTNHMYRVELFDIMKREPVEFD